MSKKSLASRLRFRVEIQEQVKISDNIGGTSVTWKLIKTVMAEFKSLYNNQMVSGEIFFAGQLTSAAYYSFVIRSCIEVNNNMRIKLRGRVFDIKKIIDEGKGYFVIITQEKFN